MASNDNTDTTLPTKTNAYASNNNDAINSTNDNGLSNPDPDTIKMFVGQIPKSWNEEKLVEFFQQYGPVYHLNILRDKETDNSRGCCFVTFYHRKDAINAQNELHNIYVMPGLSHPVQMKPADVESRNDRKLFVGMLSKMMNEEDIRKLFSEFGQIEDCNILRENGKSRGCAFLTFVNRSCAHQAIRKMNQSQIFEGCTKPMVVKFADAGKDKNAKKADDQKPPTNPKSNMQIQAVPTQQPQAIGQSGVEVLTNLVSLLQQPGIKTLLESARVIQQIQTASQCHPTSAIMQTLLNPLQTEKIASQDSSSSLTIQTTPPNMPNSTLLLPPNIAPTIGPYPIAQNPLVAVSGMNMPSNLMGPISPNPQFANFMFSPLQHMPQKVINSGLAEKGSRGPDGCNLFIYHLPQEFTDSDLYSLFSYFGSILSAKVFIDKQTNLSKCFGFVSYGDEGSAQNAINEMNGFQIGNKRLKVQLKRSDANAKPYDKP